MPTETIYATSAGFRNNSGNTFGQPQIYSEYTPYKGSPSYNARGWYSWKGSAFTNGTRAGAIVSSATLHLTQIVPPLAPTGQSYSGQTYQLTGDPTHASVSPGTTGENLFTWSAVNTTTPRSFDATSMVQSWINAQQAHGIELRTYTGWEVQDIAGFDNANKTYITYTFTAPTAPTIAPVSPADGATVGSSPEFQVRITDPDPSAITWRIQIAGNPQFTTPIVDTGHVYDGGVGPMTNALRSAVISAVLPDGGPYYWHAHAMDAAGLVTYWTATRTFMVVAATTPAVALEAPASEANVQTASPSFKFKVTDPDTGALEARVEVFDQDAVLTHDSGWYAIGDGPVSNTTISYNIPVPLVNGVYNWRVSVRDFTGRSRTTDLRELMVNVPPERMRVGDQIVTAAYLGDVPVSAIHFRDQRIF